MFSTSLDILNLVLSLSVLLLTLFLCWALYNVIISLERINKITKLIETGIVKIDEVVNIAKDKLHSSSAYFMILVELAKKAMDFVQEKRGELKTVKKAKKK
ncbi:MAG: hypothetical protein ACOYL8_02440 [Patescibacteria group bacterium]